MTDTYASVSAEIDDSNAPTLDPAPIRTPTAKPAQVVTGFPKKKSPGQSARALAPSRVPARNPDEETARRVMSVAETVLYRDWEAVLFKGWDSEAPVGRVAEVLPGRDAEALTGRDAEAIRVLLAAVSGVENTKRMRPAERRARLQRARALLAPYISVMMRDKTQRAWVEEWITPRLDGLARSIDRSVAEELVEADASGSGDLASADLATEKQVPQLLHAAMTLNEAWLRVEHASHDPHGHTEEKPNPAARQAELNAATDQAELNAAIKTAKQHPGFEKLEQVPEGVTLAGLPEHLQMVLWALDAGLRLSDKEPAEQHHGPTMAEDIEHFKVAVEILGIVVALSLDLAAMQYAKYAARARAFAEQAAEADDFAKQAAVDAEAAMASVHVFSDVVAGLEVLHGIVVLRRTDAPAEAKEEALQQIVENALWLLLRGLGWLGVEGAAAGASPWVGALSVAYTEGKLSVQFYGEARGGLIAGFMRDAFQTMRDSADQIADSATRLASAGVLAERESDPRQRAALREVEQDYAERTATAVDDFLEECEPRGYVGGEAFYPGAYPTLRKHFAPLMRRKGAKTPAEAAAAANAVLSAIFWAFDNAQGIVAAEGGSRGLPTESKLGAGGHE